MYTVTITLTDGDGIVRSSVQKSEDRLEDAIAFAVIADGCPRQLAMAAEMIITIVNMCETQAELKEEQSLIECAKSVMLGWEEFDKESREEHTAYADAAEVQNDPSI